MLHRFIATTAALAVGAALVGGCSSSGGDPGGPGMDPELGQAAEGVDTICNEKASASIDGIPAYAYCNNFDVWSNNGIDTKKVSGGTGWVQTEHGYGYQCVEFAVRYMRFTWKVPASWGVLYAKQMCTTHPSGVTVTTKPVHGDLVVFGAGSCGADPTAGHVAVVDTVAATKFTAVQENTAGKYTWNNSCASCFLHAANNKPPVADAGKPADAASGDASGDASGGDASGDASGDAAPTTDAASSDAAPIALPDGGAGTGSRDNAGGCSVAAATATGTTGGARPWLGGVMAGLLAAFAARRRRRTRARAHGASCINA